jgi:thiamine-phosphate pyrophosphorylase
VAVTDRRELPAGETLPRRVAALVAAGADLVVLREKDLDEKGYRTLARDVLREVRAACGAAGRARVLLHGRPRLARELGAGGAHLTLAALAEARREGAGPSGLVGASVHAPGEVACAARLGASYVLAGTVFATPCKPGRPGQGLAYLEEAAAQGARWGAAVYAVGGVVPANVASVRAAGARGAAVRGPLMRAADPAAVLRDLRAALG